MMPETFRESMIFITGGFFMFGMLLASVLWRKYHVGLALRELIAGYNEKEPEHESFHNSLLIRMLRWVLSIVILLAIANSFVYIATGGPLI